MKIAAILWRRLDQPGHDHCVLRKAGAHWHLSGTAVFSDRGQPCRLDYLVACDEAWRTVGGRVGGWLGKEAVAFELLPSSMGGWSMNDRPVGGTEGCVDLDLAFTPATNLIPVRRLALHVGESAPARAAWLSFPELALEPLDQEYRRTGPSTYRYGADGFDSELEVDDAGFIVRYPGRWEAVATDP